MEQLQEIPLRASIGGEKHAWSGACVKILGTLWLPLSQELAMCKPEVPAATASVMQQMAKTV